MAWSWEVIMKGRRFLRRDILLPVFYLVFFGAVLYYLDDQFGTLPLVRSSPILVWLVRIILVVYLLLVMTTLKYVLSTYDLERYDPGNLESLKRLMKRRRYQLRKKEIPTEALLVDFEAYLLTKGYCLEADSHLIGRVYRRKRPLSFLTHTPYDRVIILQHEPLNIFVVDQLLQDCVRYIQQQEAYPSKRNLLLVVTRMKEAEEIASCGAGVVNFLGRFGDGTLGVLLLATTRHRLFYQADRSLHPLSHRWFQDRLRIKLKHLIFTLQRGVRTIDKKSAAKQPIDLQS